MKRLLCFLLLIVFLIPYANAETANDTNTFSFHDLEITVPSHVFEGDASTDEQMILIVVPRERNIWIQAYDNITNGSTAEHEEYANGFFSKFTNQITPMKNSTVDGYDAYHANIAQESCDIVFYLVFSDSNIYLLSFLYNKNDLESFQPLIDDAVASIRFNPPDAMSEVLTFSGTETDILSGISLQNRLHRLTYSQDVRSNYKISIVADGKTREMFSGNEYGNTDFIIKGGEYDFFIETDKLWTLEIEPVALTESISMSGDSSLVSDIFPLDKSTIIQIDVEFTKFANITITYYTQSRWGWRREEMLMNELKNEGETYSKKFILKTDEPTNGFFHINTSKSGTKWRITVP
jgi:hypothetical protein